MTLYAINEQLSSLADFVSKANTWLTSTLAVGDRWNADRHVPASGEWAVSRAAQGTNTNDIQVAFQWDTSSPRHLAVYQYNHASGAGNYNGTNSPWAQSNDSGNGAASTTDTVIDNERSADITNSPVQYWGFAQSGAGLPQYAYFVIQRSATQYVSFGFGELDKFNDWDGGAFAFGHRFQTGPTTNQTIQTGSTHLLDGHAQDGSTPNPTNAMELYMATINVENLPQQVASGMYAVVGGNQADKGNDRQSTPIARTLFVGGFRANEIARSLGNFIPSPQSGYVPGYPIMCWYWHQSPSTVYGPMGVMPNVRGVMMTNFSPGEEITVGGQVWTVFPAYKIGTLTEASASKNQGYAIRKS